MSSHNRLEDPASVSRWLSINPESYVSGSIEFKKGAHKDKSFINWGCYISDFVEIGQNVMMGPNVVIHSSVHGTKRDKPMARQKTVFKKIVIGDDVWIGAGAIILGGSIVNNGAVIAAGSVLMEDTIVGEYEIWAGNPARKIKERE